LCSREAVCRQYNCRLEIRYALSSAKLLTARPLYLNLLAVSYIGTKYLLKVADEEPGKGKRTFKTA
jgi:hypothetical protein